MDVCVLMILTLIMNVSSINGFISKHKTTSDLNSGLTDVPSLKDYVDREFKTLHSDMGKLYRTLKYHQHRKISGDVSKTISEIRFNLSTLSVDIRQLLHGRHFLKKRLQHSFKTKTRSLDAQLSDIQNSLSEVSDDVGLLTDRVDAIEDGVERVGIDIPRVITTPVTEVQPTSGTFPKSTEQEVLVRLVGGGQGRHRRRRKPHKGRVEILYKGEWGTICDDSWEDNDAKVICKMLGFMRGGRALGEAAFGQGTGRIWLDDVGCTGQEHHIMQCPKYFQNSCGHHEDAGVECYEDDPLIEDLRLVGGRSSSEGRVEINRNGRWGTICGDQWDDRDANVVCWMLKYDYGYANTSGTFGRGTGEIWMDDVLCHGSEENIYECGHRGWRLHDCSHDNDAGVTCRNWDDRIKNVGHVYTSAINGNTARRGDMPP